MSLSPENDNKALPIGSRAMSAAARIDDDNCEMAIKIVHAREDPVRGPVLGYVHEACELANCRPYTMGP